jgi:transcriptional regulator with GAF, ATPase, and Fis domain
MYYRVNVFVIRIPPLRDRDEDVMLLAESFLEEIARARDGRRFTLTPLAAGALRAYHWPATPVSSETSLSARLSSATAHSSRGTIFRLTQRQHSAPVTRLG